jgi:hypothetical protein
VRLRGNHEKDYYISGSQLIAAGLGLYGKEKIEDTNVPQYHSGTGRNRHWRVTCDQEFELSERSEVFDRWALSKRASVSLVMNQLDSVESFVKMVNKLEKKIVAYERKQIKSIFEFVLQRIETDEDTHICFAIVHQSKAHVGYEHICKKLISGRLDRILNYEHWVYRHHPKIYEIVGLEDFKQGRILWLKSLIQEFS